MKTVAGLIVALCCALAAQWTQAQGNLEIDSPAVSAVRSALQQRHPLLAPHYASGAVGLTRDGLVAIRDLASLPLAQRGPLNALVAAENRDRAALYREIARANGHPEWAAQIQSTFAQRWIDKAQPGWWFQRGDGAWASK